jgi:hypothetical protein
MSRKTKMRLPDAYVGTINRRRLRTGGDLDSTRPGTQQNLSHIYIM